MSSLTAHATSIPAAAELLGRRREGVGLRASPGLGRPPPLRLGGRSRSLAMLSLQVPAGAAWHIRWPTRARAGWFRLGTSLINLRLPDEAAVAFQTAAVLEPQCAAPLQTRPKRRLLSLPRLSGACERTIGEACAKSAAPRRCRALSKSACMSAEVRGRALGQERGRAAGPGRRKAAAGRERRCGPFAASLLLQRLPHVAPQRPACTKLWGRSRCPSYLSVCSPAAALMGWSASAAVQVAGPLHRLPSWGPRRRGTQACKRTATARQELQ